MNYKDQLEHPKWQKKRLHILDRDDWQCQCCFDRDLMLTVHHKVYDKSLMAWEYPDKDYITLSKLCHDDLHLLQNKYMKDGDFVKDIIVDSLSINYTDFHFLTKRFQQILEREKSIKSAIQLLTSYIITKDEM